MKSKMLRFVMLVTMLFSALTPVTVARAIVVGCSWNGSVNANWSTTGNWNSGCSGAGGIPGTGDTLTFPTGASNTTMTDDLPAISLNSLKFTSTLGYTLNGSNTISLTSGIDVQGGNQIINTPLAVLNAGVIFHVAAASSLTLGGTLNLGTHDLSATVDTSAGVTGMQILNTANGSGAAKISKNGTGDLKFGGDDHSSIFDIDVNTGSISTIASSPTYLPYDFGSKITLASGTDLNLNNSGVIGSIAGSGTIHASSFFQIRQYQDTTFIGDIFGSNQLAVVGGGVTTLTIDRSGGSLSYTGEINSNAGGYLKLVNTNATSASYFTVAQGVLELNNSQVGTINVGYSNGGYNYNGSLVLSGTTASAASQITMINNSSITSVVNSATDYGRITVTSPVDLGSGTTNFSLQGSYVPNPGNVFNIIKNTNAGTATKNNAAFPGLPQSGSIPFNSMAMTADYQATGNTTFTLTAVRLYHIYLPLVLR
jgi:hypothetical protein